MLTTGLANASGELFIYNWTEYTPPALIDKFEKGEWNQGIRGHLRFQRNPARQTAGRCFTGYDIVVPSQNFVPIMINEGLIQKVGVHKCAGQFYKNMEKRWKMPAWDPEQEY